jgi:hypothetical protein
VLKVFVRRGIERIKIVEFMFQKVRSRHVYGLAPGHELTQELLEIIDGLNTSSVSL